MDKTFVINSNDIAKNVEVLYSKSSGSRIYAVLKGNAYGMGLIPFAKELYKNNIRHFSVTDLKDAITLREYFSDVQILLLAPCKMPQDIKDALNFDITLSVDDVENAKDISNLAISEEKNATIHIKIDTGMGRYGFLPSQTEEISSIFTLQNLYIEGIFSHLHSAFNKDKKPSFEQFNTFKSVIDTLSKLGHEIPIQHICNSIGIFRFPEMHLTAIRAGSALIGRVSDVCGKTNLCKVGTLYGEVVDIKTLPKGHNIGYAALYKTKTVQKIICVNVGYSDGIAVTKANDSFRFIDILRYCFNDFKSLFRPNTLICKINGKTAKSLGRIGMTNLVLDGNSVEDVKIGDLVEIPANPIYLSPLIKREYK